MIRLRSLDGKNFFSYEQFTIRFVKGVMLITGYDTGGKDSNGSGKSTILNAICWALFGRTLKGVSGKEVVRWGCKDCSVHLVLEGDGHVYDITRSLDRLVFTIDGNNIRGHHRDIQSAIETTFKTDYPLFIRSTAFSQSQVEFLAASGDAEKKRIFKEVLGLSRLDKAYDKVRVRYDGLYKDAERLDGAVEAGSWQLRQAEDKVKQAEAAKDSWDSTKAAAIQKLQDAQRKTPPHIEPLQDEVTALATSYNDFKDINDDLAKAEQDFNRLGFEESFANKEIDRLHALLDKTDVLGSKCELCGSTLTKQTVGTHRRELEKQLASAVSARDAIVVDKNAANDYMKYLYTLKAAHEALGNRIDELSRLIGLRQAEWTLHTQRCAEIDKEIKEIQDGRNPYDNLHTSLRADCDLIRSNLERDRRQFEENKRTLDTLAFLKFVLSREGAVNYIIDREYSNLMSFSNQILGTISAGQLRVSILPQRELKSGALKDEIDIAVYVGDNKTTYWGLSDGQRQRVNIALLLALNKLCKLKGVNSFDFLLLDEVLDISLAEGGQQDVIRALKEYHRECSTIVLISHKEAFASSFTSCLHVSRDSSGVSHLTR